MGSMICSLFHFKKNRVFHARMGWTPMFGR
jgi:hypothetical protein